MAKEPEVKAEDNEPVADPDAGLVKMVKDGVHSFVHDTCVKAHEVVGWVRASV